jgi:Ca2+-binding RTX toxin-like protein
MNSVLVVFATAFAAPAFGLTVPACNGLPATIVGTTAGVINGTNGDDVIVGTVGNDIINGLAGNDTICGGGGNDTITAGLGNDTLFGEAGNDTFIWNPGDGSDRIEGSTETDTLVMNGANVAENIGLSASGTRLRLTRDIGSLTQDVAGVERVTFNARGGSDSITVASLVGTGVQQVTLEMES